VQWETALTKLMLYNLYERHMRVFTLLLRKAKMVDCRLKDFMLPKGVGEMVELEIEVLDFRLGDIVTGCMIRRSSRNTTRSVISRIPESLAAVF
jgi:hypothetical protein